MEVKKIKMPSWFTIYGVANCTFMSDNEFKVNRMNKNTPELVYNTDTGRLLYNSFTCCNSRRYGGTCNCINHSTKIWSDLTDKVEGILE